MKILLINQPRFQGNSVTREGRCEFICNYRVDTPATLLIIASLLRNLKNQIEFVDCNANNLNYNYLKKLIAIKSPECVIFTFNSWIIDFDLKVSRIAKELYPSCKTIGYSWFARGFSNEILTRFKSLDIQIIDDPFSVVENLINCLNEGSNLEEILGIAYRDKNDKIKINKELNDKKSFKDLPKPAYDLIKSFRPYFLYTPLLRPYALVYAGRGCPYSCAYCPDANTQYSGRSAEDIIKELKILKDLGNIKYIWFYDQVFTINRKRVIDFCKKIIKENLRIYWFCDSRTDLVDKKILKLMKAAGCIGIAYGIESGSQKILNSMKKSITIKQAKTALEWSREARIPIQLNLIIGYIGEDKTTLKETENFVRLTLPEIMQIFYLRAYNGTEFTKLAKKNNWIYENLKWDKIIGDIPINKQNYKPFQLDLHYEIKNLYKALYMNPKWWINGVKTLVKNPQLLLPLLGVFLNRTNSIKIVKQL